MKPLHHPQILKAAKVQGKTLCFRDAGVNDAEFILSLRPDKEKSRYLSPVSPELTMQQEWLRQYSVLDKQAYFIIEYESLPIGTVRLYDPTEFSFCWGSWVLVNSRPGNAAIESALMVYAYATDWLGFHRSHFDVRKGNERVWQFHERFGAVRTQETEMDFLYQIDKSDIACARQNYSRFLDGSVTVEYL